MGFVRHVNSEWFALGDGYGASPEIQLCCSVTGEADFVMATIGVSIFQQMFQRME
jgi:hypothetical protein